MNINVSSINKNNPKIIRISVANFVADINWKIVGIINKKRLRLWMKNIWLIWWWALLLDKEPIQELWWFDFENNDARFKISSNRLNEILDIFSQDNPHIYEKDIGRELIEELSEEMFLDMKEPVLSKDDCLEFQANFIGTTYSEWLWSYIKRKVVTKYIWHLFSLDWPSEVIEKMKQNKIIYFLNECDFNKKMSHDWLNLWPNLFTVKKFLEDR